MKNKNIMKTYSSDLAFNLKLAVEQINLIEELQERLLTDFLKLLGLKHKPKDNINHLRENIYIEDIFCYDEVEIQLPEKIYNALDIFNSWVFPKHWGVYMLDTNEEKNDFILFIGRWVDDIDDPERTEIKINLDNFIN